MANDAAIETADVVIQTVHPSTIVTVIQIARSTRNIVWQNIGLAMGVKILILALGALGLASLWEAVFADVGVALLAILNAIRIKRMKFEYFIYFDYAWNLKITASRVGGGCR